VRLTIDIPPDLEERLRHTAARDGVDAAEYVRRLLLEKLGSDAAPDEATLKLLSTWDAEDATDDPSEIGSRQEEWERFKQALNESHSSNRRVYP
jgi:hypothetical protein